MNSTTAPSSIQEGIAPQRRQSLGRTETESLIPQQKLAQFINLLAGTEKCDGEVLQLMSNVCTEFIVNLIDEACQLSRLKESKTLEHDDVRLILERMYNIRIPPKGISTEPKTQEITKEHDVHLKRLAQIRQYHYLSRIPMVKSPTSTSHPQPK